MFTFPCDITGCSRTDSGVHANEFCVAVTKRKESGIETSIPIDKIPLAFASVLPPDISVWGARWVEDDFHPRYDVKYKEYVYLIWNGSARDPFLNDRCWHCPKKIDAEGILRMQEAAKALVGKKDFASFMAADSKIKETV